ncbi:hypothetical protein [Jannaschia marina]|uniref:hypothetical protein n=1 Tax=Jannaschia marina TaxID=2741674 RepID=UPI0015CC4A26|nr:hypothetical protein [Jannaschia marina]
MRTYGRSPAARLLLALALVTFGQPSPAEGVPSFEGLNPMEGVPVPDHAHYFGNEYGGEFVILERNDIEVDGEILPAFNMALYGAYFDDEAGTEGYGIARFGSPQTSGLALWIPPLSERAATSPYGPPSIDYIYGRTDGRPNAWSNSGYLHVRLKPAAEDPSNRHVGYIVPVLLEDAPPE